MGYKERIPKELFEDDGHYLGRPADFTDRIIARRVRLVEKIKHFTGKNNTLLEIGCGNGASLFMLADKMMRCDGIEVTDEHQEDFNRHKERLKIKNCTYRIMDVVGARAQEQYDRIMSF